MNICVTFLKVKGKDYPINHNEGKEGSKKFYKLDQKNAHNLMF